MRAPPGAHKPLPPCLCRCQCSCVSVSVRSWPMACASMLLFCYCATYCVTPSCTDVCPRRGVVAQSYSVKRQLDHATGKLRMLARPDTYRGGAGPPAAAFPLSSSPYSSSSSSARRPMSAPVPGSGSPRSSSAAGGGGPPRPPALTPGVQQLPDGLTECGKAGYMPAQGVYMRCVTLL